MVQVVLFLQFVMDVSTVIAINIYQKQIKKIEDKYLHLQIQ